MNLSKHSVRFIEDMLKADFLNPIGSIKAQLPGIVPQDNPYLSIAEPLLRDPNMQVKDWNELAVRYSWAIPTQQAIDLIKNSLESGDRIVSMGAGTGYWESLMEGAGIDVK